MTLKYVDAAVFKALISGLGGAMSLRFTRREGRVLQVAASDDDDDDDDDDERLGDSLGLRVGVDVVEEEEEEEEEEEGAVVDDVLRVNIESVSLLAFSPPTPSSRISKLLISTLVTPINVLPSIILNTAFSPQQSASDKP
jgi:hypothetical protein